MGRNAKLKERQKWSNEQPKLDNARILRGNYFIDLEDKEFKETIKSARKKLETPMTPAMPCKTSKKSKHGETRGKTNEFTSKLACILEVSESSRLRMEEALPNFHEDHVAGKGTIHCNIVIGYTNLFLCLKPGRSPQQKHQWIKNGKNWKKNPAWNLTKVRSKSEVIDEARTMGAKVHFASLMDICHLRNAELEAKHQKYKGRVVLRNDIVKDDS